MLDPAENPAWCTRTGFDADERQAWGYGHSTLQVGFLDESWDTAKQVVIAKLKGCYHGRDAVGTKSKAEADIPKHVVLEVEAQVCTRDTSALTSIDA